MGQNNWPNEEKKSGAKTGRKIMTRLLAVILIVMSLGTPSVLAENAVDARQELEMLGIPFNADEFVTRAEWGDLLAIELMLDAGMPVDTRNRDGVPALVAAVTGGGIRVRSGKDIVFLRPFPMPREPRHSAVILTLLNRGADPNITERQGQSPIMLAAQAGNKTVVRTLLDKSADVNAKDADGETALMLASRHGHAAIARLLIESGADVNTANHAGMTPLRIAKENGRTKVAILLLENGADPQGAELLAAVTGPAAQLEDRVRALEATITILQTENISKENRVDALENQMKKLAEQIAALHKKLVPHPELLSEAR